MIAVGVFLLVGDDDRDTIQGRWKPISIERGGKPIASRTGPNDKMALIIGGNRYDWTSGDEPMAGTYRLDPSKTPKELDMMPGGGANQGSTLKGIYQIEGDTLYVCLAAPGEGRPTEFESKEGSRHSFYIMRRVKEGEAERISIKESLDRLEKALDKRTRAEIPFDLVLGQSVPFLRLKEKPLNVQVLNRQIVEFNRFDPNGLVLSPQGIGRTRMNLTFGGQADHFIANLVINVRPYEVGKGDEGRIATKESPDRLKKALAKRDDTEIPLKLDLGQPLLIPLDEVPAMLLVTDPQVLEFTLVTDKSVLLQPKHVGRTPMAMLFRVGPDQSEWFVITLQIRVQKAE
jgi:uncharacterized protein (TIGR03067 family)